jgi:hypothetical protein
MLGDREKLPAAAQSTKPGISPPTYRSRMHALFLSSIAILSEPLSRNMEDLSYFVSGQDIRRLNLRHDVGGIGRGGSAARL